MINNHSFGTYHLVGKSFVSPYEIGLVISKLFSFDQRKIKQVTAEEFFQHKAKRPFKNRIKNDKLEKLGFKTKTFSEGLSLIKNTL